MLDSKNSGKGNQANWARLKDHNHKINLSPPDFRVDTETRSKIPNILMRPRKVHFDYTMTIIGGLVNCAFCGQINPNGYQCCSPVKILFTYLSGKTQEKTISSKSIRLFGIKLNGERPIRAELWTHTFPKDLVKELSFLMDPRGHTILLNIGTKK